MRIKPIRVLTFTSKLNRKPFFSSFTSLSKPGKLNEMVFGMILPIQNRADIKPFPVILSRAFYLSWPAFDTHISHARKHFSSSFELKVSIQEAVITIVIEFFADHLKFQNLRFFLQFLVSHIPLADYVGKFIKDAFYCLH